MEVGLRGMETETENKNFETLICSFGFLDIFSIYFLYLVFGLFDIVNIKSEQHYDFFTSN